MAQIHMLVNLTKREFINPMRLGDEGTMMDAVYAAHEKPPGGILHALANLTACPVARGGGDFRVTPIMGRWHGDRVLFVGEFAEATDFRTDDHEASAHDIYKLCLSPGDEDPDIGVPPFADITEAVGIALAQGAKIVYHGAGSSITRSRWDDLDQDKQERYGKPGYYAEWPG